MNCRNINSKTLIENPIPQYVPRRPRTEAELRGYLGHLTDKEKETLATFRASLADVKSVEVEQEIGVFKLDDECLLRFLRARNFNLGKAEKMLRTHIDWRNKHVPGNIKPKDIEVSYSKLARF